MSNGTIRLYGAGGCGSNIVKTYASVPNHDSYAVIKSTYIDTSRANIDESIDEEQCFFLPDTDGSGAIRAENHVEISASIKPMLLKHTPEELNIVVFSASGGSGSVIGPLLLRELLARGHSAIGIMIGSSESKIRCQNTLNSFKSLDNISAKLEMPVVVDYFHNGLDGKPSEIDTGVRHTIAALAALCAGTNKRLDSRDVSNFINYHRVSEVPPQVSNLHVCTDEKAALEISNPISMASLLSDQDTDIPAINAAYDTSGFRDPNSKEDVPDIHCIIDVDSLEAVHRHIKGELAAYAELNESRDNARRSFVEKGDDVTEDDLVL